ncbi:MAG: GTPase domain-containing protein [Promethearchaeia archaeon]
MTNVGLLGSISAGKTSLLRIFMKYLNLGKLKDLGDGEYSIIKTEFGGESKIPEGDKENKLNEKATKTIQPNRVVFRDKRNGKAHTLLAPGGDMNRSVVRMGIVTVARIASRIVAVFTMDRNLEEQFEFFRDLRYFPEKIFICINKIDLVDGDQEKIDQATEHIKEFFEESEIEVVDTFYTCAEEIKSFDQTETYNDNAAKMMLDITVNRPA